MFVANYALLRHRGLNRATSYLVCLWAWWSTQYTIFCLHWNNLQYIHASINLYRYCLCPKYTILFCFCFVKIVCVLNFLSTVSSMSGSVSSRMEVYLQWSIFQYIVHRWPCSAGRCARSWSAVPTCLVRSWWGPSVRPPASPGPSTSSF